MNDTHGYDETTVNYIERPIIEAEAEAAKIGQREEYTPQYKRDEIIKLFQAGRAEVESRYQDEIKRLDADQQNLEPKAQLPISPPVEQAAALLYTRDMLQAQMRGLGFPQVKAMWQRAIDAKDLVALRVLVDFASGWKLGDDKMPFPGDVYQEMRDKSLPLLLSEEGIKAKAQLERNRQTRAQIDRIHAQARNRLNTQFALRSNGRIVSGAEARMARQFRENF